MKRIFTILGLFILFACPAMAQNRPAQNTRKNVEAAHVGWLTRRLDLSTEEAVAFWPVYNSYQKELEAINRQRRGEKLSGKPDNSNGPSDELEFDTQVLDLKKRYRKEFARVLPPQKVAAIFKADREFKEQLIKQLQTRRNP